MAGARELNFDGLVGPSHHFGGLSLGNVASSQHSGELSNPRQAALHGLLNRVCDLGLCLVSVHRTPTTAHS